MEKILACLVLGLFASIASAADASTAESSTTNAPKTKQVCHNAKGKDGKPVLNKDGTTKQNCKTIKIHEKFEGTAVPTTPPKK